MRPVPDGDRTTCDPASLVADGLLSIDEACSFLCLSRSKLYQLMERGELIYTKMDGARRIPKRALIAYAARCLVGVGV